MVRRWRDLHDRIWKRIIGGAQARARNQHSRTLVPTLVGQISPLHDHDALDAVGLGALLGHGNAHFHSLWWLTFQSRPVTDSQRKTSSTFLPVHTRQVADRSSVSGSTTANRSGLPKASGAGHVPDRSPRITLTAWRRVAESRGPRKRQSTGAATESRPLRTDTLSDQRLKPAHWHPACDLEPELPSNAQAVPFAVPARTLGRWPVATDAWRAFHDSLEQLQHIWHLLNGPAARYTDLGPGHYEITINKNRKARSHVHQLQALGYTVALTQAA
jgi:hypothetical protein